MKNCNHARSLGVAAAMACLFVLCGFAPAGGDETVAWQVKVVLKNGAEFEGVLQDKTVVAYFKDHESLDVEKYDPQAQLNFSYVDGLSGSMGVRLERIQSVKRLAPLTKAELDRMVQTIQDRIKKVEEQDAAHQEQERLKREAEKKRAAEAAQRKQEKAAEDAKNKAQAEVMKWLDRFPPDQGWGPDKKEELYRRGVVDGVFPSAEERLFLDHYDDWMKAFAIWTALKEKEQADQEAKQQKECSKEPVKKEPPAERRPD